MSSFAEPAPDWYHVLLRIDECPYVGPRPQKENRDAERVLIGREKELGEITQKVLDRRLVILDGYSGVGKSSLLQNGLLARLRGAGFSILVGRDWSEMPEGYKSSRSDVEAYLSRCITATHSGGFKWPKAIEEKGLEGASLSAILNELDDTTGAVLILDQFEELLRSVPRVSSDVVRWVLDLAYEQNTRIVLSLRTDSMHLLDRLVRGVKPFSMDRVSIDEVSGEDNIRRIMTTSRFQPDDASTPSRSLIDEEAVAALLEERARNVVERSAAPSLLDVQATLYALHFLSKQRSGAILIDAEDIRLLLDRSRQLKFESAFHCGLYEAIGLKVRHAEQAARERGFDEYLIEGAREAVRRAAPMLSSGGFKVPISEVELARRVLEPELRTLAHWLRAEWREESKSTGPIVEKLVAELRPSRHRGRRQAEPRQVRSDFLDMRAADMGCFEPRSDVLRSRRPNLPESWRVVDVTAGPMMASSASETALEEVRRVLFAIDWLTATELVRRDPMGNLVLIHDGAGAAFHIWESRQPETASYALHQLTAARGEHFVWDHTIGEDDLMVIPNLNWRDCRIEASFRNIVFVNCDFTGSKFDACTFAGVTFVNCLLDDANFEKCVLVGVVDLEQVSRDEGSGARLAPSFVVQTARSEATHLARYRGRPDEVSELFSDTSGTAAVPGGTPRNHTGVTVAHLVTDGHVPAAVEGSARPRIRPTSGGMAVIGGRICFLTLYRCQSEQGGSVAFHHVSGDGLYLVEQSGRVSVHDGALRGISVTRDIVDDLGPIDENSLPSQPLHLEVNKSTVQNVYFSRRLSGSAVFNDSIVMGLINASESVEKGFSVRLTNVRYQFLANTLQPAPDAKGLSSVEDSRQPGGFFATVPGEQSRFAVARLDELAKVLEPMDFRFKNEVWEEARRRENMAKQQHEQEERS